MFLASQQELKQWRDWHFSVSVATGCFDVLHVGHVRLLKLAKSKGQFLLVGINSDGSVRQLKGKSRPVVTERDRAEMLLSLSCVDAVYVFDDLRASNFLRLARPSVWVKGGDYTMESLDECERKAVEECGGKIVIAPSEIGFSTTGILSRI